MLREYIAKQRTVGIRIRVGDKLQYDDGRIGTLRAIELGPNGTSNPAIVAILTVQLKESTVTATSDKFSPVDGELYLES
jgi:hypothetical protein